MRESVRYMKRCIYCLHACMCIFAYIQDPLFVQTRSPRQYALSLNPHIKEELCRKHNISLFAAQQANYALSEGDPSVYDGMDFPFECIVSKSETAYFARLQILIERDGKIFLSACAYFYINIYVYI